MSDDDDDFDWDQLDKEIAQSQAVQPQVSKDSQEYENLKRDYNELSKQLLAAHGETSILRANITKLQESKKLDLDSKLQSESALESKYQGQIDQLNKQIEKLNNERQFMVNDQQQSLIESKFKSKKRRVETSAEEDDDGLFVPSPQTTPKKKKKKDVAADFRDGFLLSPKKKTKNVEISPQKPEPQPQPQAEPQSLYDNHQLMRDLLKRDYLANFTHLVMHHVVPFTEIYTLEELNKVCKDGTAQLIRSLGDSRIDCVCWALCGVSRSGVDAAVLSLPLLQASIEFDTSVLAQRLEDIVPVLLELVLEYSTEKVIVALYALDCLRTVAAGCCQSRGLYKRCWTAISAEFVQNVLSSRAAANVVTKLLNLVSIALADQSLVSMCGWFDSTFNQQVIRVLSSSATESPMLLYSGLEAEVEPVQHTGYSNLDLRPVTPLAMSKLTLQWTLAQQSAAIKLASLLNAVGLFDNDTDRVKLVIALVDILSKQVDALHDHYYPGDDPMIETCVWLLHGVYNLHTDTSRLARQLPSKTTREQLVCLSRIALGQDENEPLFSINTTDRALDILEQFMTQDEAEQLYEVFES